MMSDVNKERPAVKEKKIVKLVKREIKYMYKENIDYLKNSIVYTMSLGSKELFHSNIWKYLIESDKEFAKVLFPAINVKGIKKVERENNHRDLTITVQNKDEEFIYIVENKLKSLPTLEQLKKYTAKEKKFKEGVLTGIQSSIIVRNLPTGWTFLAYKDIAKKIRDIANVSRTVLVMKNRLIINEYCECIEKIDVLLSHIFKINEQRLSYIDIETLSEIRLADIAKKHIADDFYKYFMDNYLSAFNALCPNEFTLIEPEMKIADRSKNPVFDFRFAKDNFVIGVQIEATEFRIIAQTNAINQHDKIFLILSKYGWFDKDYNKLSNPYLFGHELKPLKRKSRNLKYGKYGNDKTAKYSFVYQYFDINEMNNSYEKVSELVIEFLGKAKEIIDKHYPDIISELG